MPDIFSEFENENTQATSPAGGDIFSEFEEGGLPQASGTSQTVDSALQRQQENFEGPTIITPPAAAPSADAAPISPQTKEVIGSKVVGPIMSLYGAYKGAQRSVQETVEGVQQLGAQGLQAVGVDTTKYQEDLARTRAEREAEYQTTKAVTPTGSVLGYIGGLLSQGGLGPTLVGKSLLQKFGIGAGTGAALGGAQYVEENQTRVSNALLGAVLGGTVPGAIGLGGKAVKRLLSEKPKAAVDIAESLKRADAEKVEDLQKASERLGTTTTPFEAAPDQLLKMRAGRIPLSGAQQEDLAQFMMAREANLKTQAASLMDSLVPEGEEAATAAKNALYKQIADVQVAEDILTSDPRIKRQAMLAIKNNPDINLRTVEHVDEVKRLLTDEYNDLMRKGRTNSARKLLDAKNKMVKQAEEAVEAQLGTNAYGEARAIAARLAIKRDFQDKLAKVALEAGEDTPTMSQFYKTFFGSISDRANFRQSVARAGGDVQQANDLMVVLNAIEKSPLTKTLRKDPRSAAVQFGQTAGARMVDLLKSTLEGRYNNAVMEIALNPKWADEIAKLSKMKKPIDQLTGLGRIIEGMGTGRPAAMVAPRLTGEESGQ